MSETPAQEERIDFLAAMITGEEGSGDEQNPPTVESSVEWPEADDLVFDPSKPMIKCRVCGFPGANIHCADADASLQICRECHVYEDPTRWSSQFVMAWMPDYSPKGISLLSKLLPLADKTEIWDKIAEQSAPDTHTLKPELRNIRNIEAFVAYKEKSVTSKLEQRRGKFSLTKNHLAGIKIAIGEGISRANRILGEASIAEVIEAMDVMDLVDRVSLESGLRYIPRTIDPELLSVANVNAFSDLIFEAVSNDLTAFGVSNEADASLLDESTLAPAPAATVTEGA